MESIVVLLLYWQYIGKEQSRLIFKELRFGGSLFLFIRKLFIKMRGEKNIKCHVNKKNKL